MGKRQTFVRFLGCNLSCRYCDTPETQKVEGPFVHQGKTLANPIEVDFLIDKFEENEIAITGGEPLLQIDFLLEVCERIAQMHRRTYLDTNGTLPHELEKVIKYINTVSLDFKIPTATHGPELWDAHEACLKIASAKEVFVKLVINENVLPEEMDNACGIIESVDKRIPLVIQPVFGQYIPNILDIQKKALGRLKDVRIIPQVHKYMGLA